MDDCQVETCRPETIEAVLAQFPSLRAALVWLGRRYARTLDEYRRTHEVPRGPGFDSKPPSKHEIERHDLIESGEMESVFSNHPKPGGSIGDDIQAVRVWLRAHDAEISISEILHLARHGGNMRTEAKLATIDTVEMRREFWDRLFTISPHLASEIASLTKTHKRSGESTMCREPGRPTRKISLTKAAQPWFKMDRRTLLREINDGRIVAHKVSPRAWIFDIDQVRLNNAEADCEPTT